MAVPYTTRDLRPRTQHGTCGSGPRKERGTGAPRAGVKFYLSGMSSKARGLSEGDLEGVNYQFATPNDLVRLAVEHDRQFTY